MLIEVNEHITVIYVMPLNENIAPQYTQARVCVRLAAVKIGMQFDNTLELYTDAHRIAVKGNADTLAELLTLVIRATDKP